MKKASAVLIMSLFLFASWSLTAGAEMMKEGTGTGTNVYSATSTVAPIDKEHFAMIYEAIGVNLSDTGEGPFHNMSTHNVGVIYFGKGVGKLLGYMTMTDPDGDKVLVEIKEDTTLPAPNPNKGTGKFIGGTGKYFGIEGTVEYTRYYTRPSKEGVAQAVSHSKATWKIP